MIQFAELDGPQWRFALELYAGENVAAACLALQDRWNVDVIVLIAALYGAVSFTRTPTLDELSQMDVDIAQWRETVVHPLRAIRRHLKTIEFGPAAGRLREVIKSSELRSEQIQLAALAPLSDRFSGSITLAPLELGEVISMIASHYGASIADLGDIQIISRPIIAHSIYLHSKI